MKISVVMATYNGGKFLADQLESIINNSRPPEEIIIVDDASTDETLDIIESVSATSNIAIHLHVNSSNIGPTPSFIKGVRSALGDIILFSDQDDHWYHDKIERIIEPFTLDPFVLLTYSDGIITDGNRRSMSKTIFSTRKKQDLHLGDARSVSSFISDPDIKGCTMGVRNGLIRLALPEDLTPFWPYWGHDHWIAVLAFAYGKVDVINAPLMDHRFHGRNASAGVRFNPFRSSHWTLWMNKVRSQSNDHDLVKYELLQGHLLKNPRSIRRDGILEEVQYHIDLAQRRMHLRRQNAPMRFRQALQLWNSGVYGKHHNGIWTFLRDLLI